jgi:putative ABC transport system permease protein
MWEFPVERSDLTTQTAARSIQEMERMEVQIQGNRSPGFANSVTIRTDLPFIVRRTAALGEVLRSSVAPIAAVAVISALGLLGAAGSYWVDRRRAEVTLLITKGIGPRAIALKAVVEMAGAVGVGVLLGWLIALGLGAAVGPAPLIDWSARWHALLFTLGAGAVGLGGVATVVGVRSTRVLDKTKRGWRTAARIPALVFFIAAAGLAWLGLQHGAITVAQGDQAGRVGTLVLAFPFLLFGSMILLAAELLSRLLGRRRSSERSRSPTLFLASRRIASSSSMALVLIAAAAFPVATLVYATSLSRSSASVIEAKAKSFIGSDLAVAMVDDRAAPTSLAGSATQVTRYERALVSGQEVDIIGVDLRTFPDGAYWHDSFSGRTLEEFLSLLTLSDPDGRLTVAVANGSITGSNVGSDRWGDVVAAFERENVTFAWINAADDVLDQLKYAVIMWTFDFVEIIALLAALIVVAGVFLYGDARQRARNLSYALVRKMGLSRQSHLIAGFLELLVLLGLGLVVGALAAIAASATGALLSQRIADGADTSELLRPGG